VLILTFNGLCLPCWWYTRIKGRQTNQVDAFAALEVSGEERNPWPKIGPKPKKVS